MPELVAVVNPYPHTAALLGSTLRTGDGTDVRFVGTAEYGGAVSAISRMLSGVPDLDYDIGELPLVNYLAAKERGAAFTAIPVILTRRFPHATLIANRATGVAAPADLRGKRVGVSYYGNTDVAWARGLLAEYGLDLDTVTWVTAFGEQVAGARLPANILHVPRVDLYRMLQRGELAGLVISHTQSYSGPDLFPLIPDAETALREWYGRTGVFPPLHTVVVKDSVLARHPGLAKDLYEAFDRAKAARLAALDAPLTGADRTVARASGFPVAPGAGDDRGFLGADPLPYGLAANEAALEMLIGYAADQHMLGSAPKPSDLFVDVGSV